MTIAVRFQMWLCDETRLEQVIADKRTPKLSDDDQEDHVAHVDFRSLEQTRRAIIATVSAARCTERPRHKC